MKKILVILFFIYLSSFIFAEYVSTDGLNVRSNPSTDSLVLGQLKFGDEIKIFETHGTWSKIRYNNQDGWISSKYISENIPVKTEVNEVENKKFVQLVGDFLHIVGNFILERLIVVIYFIFNLFKNLYQILYKFSLQLGFNIGWAKIVAVITEIVILFIIVNVLHSIYLQFTLLRCSSCKKVGALKYTGRSEVTDSWISSERKSVDIRSNNGEKIGSCDEYIPVTKEKVKKLYRCKYCGEYENIYKTRTK